MRLVSFFFLSVALHAVALAYPVSFGDRSQVELIEATILPIEQESIDEIGDGSANPALAASSKPAKRTAPEARAGALSEPTAMAPPTATNQSSDAEPKTLPVEASHGRSDDRIALVSATADSASTQSGALVGSLGNSLKHSGTSGNASGDSGLGWAGTASGQGSAESGILATHARYRDTPRPEYPESARREGREGRVLLRVLIDDQGRAKTVEINTSSGSQVLDRAAAEAIQRWRFHPARYGNQPVESWLRVPIEFRLADVKSW